jgi:hypothetical protein
MRTSDGRKGRRRVHAAASSRIFTAGVSSAAAFGMVAGMALAAGAGPDGEPSQVALDQAAWAPPATTPAPRSREVVVIRRHWIQVPSGPATPAVLPTRPTSVIGPGGSAPAAASATPVRAPQPAPQRPITRSRGS